jgi:hypothetical protein
MRISGTAADEGEWEQGVKCLPCAPDLTGIELDPVRSLKARTIDTGENATTAYGLNSSEAAG